MNDVSAIVRSKARSVVSIISGCLSLQLSVWDQPTLHSAPPKLFFLAFPLAILSISLARSRRIRGVGMVLVFIMSLMALGNYNDYRTSREWRREWYAGIGEIREVYKQLMVYYETNSLPITSISDCVKSGLLSDLQATALKESQLKLYPYTPLSPDGLFLETHRSGRRFWMGQDGTAHFDRKVETSP